MAAKAYEIIYSQDVKSHLRSIPKKYWGLIKEKIIGQLRHHPDVETRNRKPLTKPPVDDRWELRFGQGNRFRVFYEIHYELQEVWILAIGEKIKDKLIIMGKEIEL